MKKSTDSIQIKNAFFFSHDSNARNDEKIINLRMQYGAEGYGVYFMLVEMLMEGTNYMLATNYLALAFNLHVSKELVQSIIEDFDLFDFSDDLEFFYSPSLNKRVKPLEQLREQRRQAGKRSAEVRGAKSEKEDKKHAPQVSSERVFNDRSTSVDQKLNRVEESREEKSKEEESKEEESKIEQNRVQLVPAEPAKAKASDFVPPTLLELQTYCVDNQYKINTDAFLDFYQSKGWMVGQNKMKDWQAAVRNWLRKDLEDAQKRQHSLPMKRAPNIANHKNDKDYEQF